MIEPFPADYSGANKPACTQSYTGNITISSTPADGVICATGMITISGSQMTANVTFIADSFSFTGTGNAFTPYSTANGLSYYETGSTTMNFAVPNLAGGTVFAPNATVLITAPNFTTTGFVEAQQIDVQTPNFTLTGNGPPMPGSAGALSE